MTLRGTAVVVAVAALLGAVTFAGTASAETTLEKIRAADSIRIGFPNQVPYAYADETGKLTGADAEVAKEVIRRMGIANFDGVITEFAGLIPGLKAGRFDIALAMFVNPKRCAEVDFSEPIYGIGQSLIVQTGNPKNIGSYDDIVQRDDIVFGIMAGAVQGIYAQKLGIPEARVKPFPDGTAAVNAVGTGRVDTFGISTISARRMVKAAGPEAGVELVPDFTDPVIDGKPARGYGAFAFRKNDPDLLAAFNEALQGLLGSQDHLAMIEPFGFTKSNLPDKATAALCKG